MNNDIPSAKEILEENVYPYLDACEAGFFDDLNPKPSSSKPGLWYLDCPDCGKKGVNRAWYRKGGIIICNRKDSCRYRSSVWQYCIDKKKWDKKTTFNALCDAVNYTPPVFSGKPSLSSSDAFRLVTRRLAHNHINVMQEFATERLMSIDEVMDRNYGFYSSIADVENGLKELNADLVECRQLGFIPYPRNADKSNNSFFMENRIIGFWPQPNKSLGYWGYLLLRQRSSNKSSLSSKKYLFSSGIRKTIPYSFKNRLGGRPVCVEGTLDADSLSYLGINSGATGQARISNEQAEAMAERGVKECIWLSDGDLASFKGSIPTVLNCLDAGILCHVVTTPKKLDDADKMRQKRQDQLLFDLIDASEHPGSFLAKAWIYLGTDPFAEAYALKEQIESHLSNLPPEVHKSFFDLTTYAGYEGLQANLLKKRINKALSIDYHNKHYKRAITELYRGFVSDG